MSISASCAQIESRCVPCRLRGFALSLAMAGEHSDGSSWGASRSFEGEDAGGSSWGDDSPAEHPPESPDSWGAVDQDARVGERSASPAPVLQIVDRGEADAEQRRGRPKRRAGRPSNLSRLLGLERPFVEPVAPQAMATGPRIAGASLRLSDVESELQVAPGAWLRMRRGHDRLEPWPLVEQLVRAAQISERCPDLLSKDVLRLGAETSALRANSSRDCWHLAV